MKGSTLIIATRKIKSGRYVADAIEWAKNKEHKYTSPDYDTSHSAYRNAIQYMYEHNWAIIKSDG